MILVNLDILVVFGQKQRQFSNLGPALDAHFGLQCLFCGQLHQLSCPTVYRLKAKERPYMYISPIMMVVKQTRSCINCGILSTLPEIDEKELKKKLEKTIVQEFIDYHSQTQPPFLAQRLVERLKLVGT